MYKRVEFGEDPWVSIHNHWPTGNNQIVYGEIESDHHTQILQAHGGMDVFIRKKGIKVPSWYYKRYQGSVQVH